MGCKFDQSVKPEEQRRQLQDQCLDTHRTRGVPNRPGPWGPGKAPIPDFRKSFRNDLHRRRLHRTPTRSWRKRSSFRSSRRRSWTWTSLGGFPGRRWGTRNRWTWSTLAGWRGSRCWSRGTRSRTSWCRKRTQRRRPTAASPRTRRWRSWGEAGSGRKASTFQIDVRSVWAQQLIT